MPLEVKGQEESNSQGKSIFESSREKYKPETIEYLFIAESPPKPNSNRFFYFENVFSHDLLFWETMKALYPNAFPKDKEGKSIVNKDIRKLKSSFLKKFKLDGFFLVDACDISIAGVSSHEKEAELKRSLPELIKKVQRLISKDTKIIVITSTVYKICYHKLKSEGFNVINNDAIPYPLGFQNEFKNKLLKYLTDS